MAKHFIDRKRVTTTENNIIPTSTCSCSAGNGGGAGKGMMIMFIIMLLILSVAGGYYVIKKNKI